MEKNSISPESDSGCKGRVIDVVGAYVEPLTRFDAGNLMEVKEGFSRIPILINTDQMVTFGISRNDGYGELPSGVTDLGDKSKYDLSLATSLNMTRANSKEAIALWVKQDEGAYRRLLPVKAAFKFPPGSVGYERVCDTCNGGLQVVCSRCEGDGKIPCSACGCTGKVNCHGCHGSTSLTCETCGGGGKKYVNESYSVWDSYAKVNRIDYRQVAYSCSTCWGSGSMRCYLCTGGRVTCYGCGGNAYLRCGPCSGSGRVDCNSCKASGILHRWATIVANVVVSDERIIESDDDILKNLMQERLVLNEYSRLGIVVRVFHSISATESATKLSSEYDLLIEVRCAEVDVRGKLMKFYGFGPQLKVVDFLNVAGVLLEDDLCSLENSVVEGDLLQVTLKFVESEVNLKIVEGLLPSGAEKDGCVALTQQFNGVVNEDYINRANSALALALSKLFVCQFRFTYFCVLVFGLLLGLFMQLYKWPVSGMFAIVVICVFSTLIIWLLCENIIQRKVSKKFPALVSGRIYILIKCGDGVKQIRVFGGMVFAILLSFGLWGCNYVTEHFPWVQKALLYRPFDS